MQKKKKKKRFGYYLYAVVALTLAIVNVTLAALLLTYVQEIQVSGTKYSQKSKVEAWVKEEPYTFNSIYTVLKFKVAQPELPAYLESASVGWKAPWKLSVKVKEKEIAGCILQDSDYVYFTEDGTVMKKGTEILEGIPIIEGLNVETSTLYQPIEVENEKIFKHILELSEEVQKNKLQPERLIWEEEGMSLHFGEIKVLVGRINYQEKLIQLPPILKKLEGKKGVLHLEHYNEMSTTISFVEETE